MDIFELGSYILTVFITTVEWAEKGLLGTLNDGQSAPAVKIPPRISNGIKLAGQLSFNSKTRNIMWLAPWPAPVLFLCVETSRM